MARHRLTEEERLRGAKAKKPAINELGRKYGKWTVLEGGKTQTNGSALWLCRCDCGVKKQISGSALRGGRTKSCGCGRREFIDEVGNRYGHLLVIEYVGRRNRAACFRCACDCGNEAVVKGVNLRGGFSKSCGCKHGLPLHRQAVHTLYRRLRVFSKRRGKDCTITLGAFSDMVQQNCHYCGIEPNQILIVRGEEFFHHGLDRVDNDLGYVPGNCMPACGICNYAKQSMTFDEFREWIKRVARHIA